MADTQKKEDFYVFLDFDGCMYDILSKITGLIKGNEKLLNFSPESMEAVKLLFAEISTKYTPNLVISSFWRHMFPLALKVLESNGFNVKDINISKTGHTANPLDRGLAIRNYLEEHGNSNNVMIIDNNYEKSIRRHFPEINFVECNILNGKLTPDNEALNNALVHYGLNPISTPEMEDGEFCM